ncbi:MAG: M20/M25/M40 family metallo-hydrolase [Polyangiales bacterium]
MNAPASTGAVTALHWLASLAPTRLTGTPAEKAVQSAIAERLQAAGYRIDWQPFRFAPHIYGGMAMHFGLALAFVQLGRLSHALACAGLLFVWWSFFREVTHRRHVLRALWPKVDTQNVLATLPARATMRRRIVCVAHADSAFTGLMFEPAILKLIAAPPPKALGFLRKQLALPMASILLLAALHALSALGLLSIAAWLWGLLSIPVAIVFFFNADVLLRNTVVPGAADNLSGCAAQVVLAERWAREIPRDDVEIVFAFTGAEEAGTGGAAHLARAMRAHWSASDTDILVLDTLSNGTLYALEEGELTRVPQPEELVTLARAASRNAVGKELESYVIPAGATDALVFLVEGYRALALTCIDPEQHAPRNYHHPNDTADRVDAVQLEASTRVAWELINLRAA